MSRPKPMSAFDVFALVVYIAFYAWLAFWIIAYIANVINKAMSGDYKDSDIAKLIDWIRGKNG